MVGGITGFFLSPSCCMPKDRNDFQTAIKNQSNCATNLSNLFFC